MRGATPGRVLRRHLSDQGTEFGVDRWPSSTLASRQPRPIATKTGSVPPDHGLRFHEHEDVEPPSPEAAQDDPEPTIRAADAGTSGGLGEGGELLSQGEVLDREVGVRAERRSQAAENHEEQAHHGHMRVGGDGEKRQ